MPDSLRFFGPAAKSLSSYSYGSGENVRFKACGWLIVQGVVAGRSSVLIPAVLHSEALASTTNETSKILQEFESLSSLLPAGVEIGGVWGVKSGDNSMLSEGVTVQLPSGHPLRTPPFLAVISPPDSENIQCFQQSNNGTLEALSCTVSDDSDFLTRECVTLECQLSLALPVHSNADVGSQLKEHLERMRSQLQSPTSSAFKIIPPVNSANAGSFLATGSKASSKKGSGKKGGGAALKTSEAPGPTEMMLMPGTELKVTCGEACPSLESGAAIRVMPLTLHCTEQGGPLPPAPMMTFQPTGPDVTRVRTASIELHCLAVAARCLPLSTAVTSILLPALADQLAATLPLLTQPSANLQASAFHFRLPGFAVPVTVLYPLSAQGGPPGPTAEEALAPTRLALHRLLHLPENRPLLRVANSILFNTSAASHSASSSGRLKNTHIGIPASHVVGGKQYLVDGDYEYYHYMQDHFDDKGWGCAYRSLQTLCSWFLLQHYTATTPPSHRKIQETLVALGDKPESFVGSSQWIGAIELSYILDELLGVTCKVMTIQTGAELPSHAREIAHHFTTQGTPIMIGGGVLAYTLLGIDWNEHTGDCSFLILDPHYTGGEDLNAIQGRWCGWKKGDNNLFVANAFYNLLCPQRPNQV